MGDRKQKAYSLINVLRNDTCVSIVVSECLPHSKCQLDSNHGKTWPYIVFLTSETVLACSFVK